MQYNVEIEYILMLAKILMGPKMVTCKVLNNIHKLHFPLFHQNEL